MSKPMFGLEASIDEQTGRVVAVYLRVRQGEVAETKEVNAGLIYADYDAQGSLLGVELLGPCPVDILTRFTDGEPEPIRRFLQGGTPRELVVA